MRVRACVFTKQTIKKQSLFKHMLIHSTILIVCWIRSISNTLRYINIYRNGFRRYFCSNNFYWFIWFISISVNKGAFEDPWYDGEGTNSHTRTHTHTHTHTHTYIYIYIYIHRQNICVCVCVYTYIYRYTHLQILYLECICKMFSYIYIYIYTHKILYIYIYIHEILYIYTWNMI